MHTFNPLREDQLPWDDPFNKKRNLVQHFSKKCWKTRFAYSITKPLQKYQAASRWDANQCYKINKIKGLQTCDNLSAFKMNRSHQHYQSYDHLNVQHVHTVNALWNNGSSHFSPRSSTKFFSFVETQQETLFMIMDWMCVLLNKHGQEIDKYVPESQLCMRYHQLITVTKNKCIFLDKWALQHETTNSRIYK